MIEAASWYIVVTALGWLVWPAAFRLVPGLQDRGYAFSRALGLLVVSYVFWLLGVLGLLSNTIGGLLLAILLVGGLSAWVYLSHPAQRTSLFEWLRDHSRPVITIEVLFLVAFAAWVVFRAYNPDIQYTEKPMELAFLNGVRHSPSFPPNDPWLSGYAISYYYFGYVMMSALATLTGTAMHVAFNLGIGLLFALTAIGAYSVVYNLTAAYRLNRDPDDTLDGVAASALLGPLFVGIIGNFEGALRTLHGLSPPWLGARFWEWLDIVDLDAATAGQFWPPDTWQGWWWFRASRVIHDRTPAGTSFGLQPIDEFPLFSFLLGDMHPHVLALPVVLMALALAFNALVEEKRQPRHWRWAQTALYVLTFGGLAFLNTWDLPIYVFVLIGALTVRLIRSRHHFEWADLLGPILNGLAIVGMGVVAYLPWFISFGSQAGGILPNAVFATRLHQIIVMFPLLLIVIGLVIQQAAANRRRADWMMGLIVAGGILLLLITLTVGLSAVAVRTEPQAAQFAVDSAGLSGRLTSNSVEELLPQAIGIISQHRLMHPLVPLLMTALIALTAGILLARPVEPMPDFPPFGPGVGFALVLALTGALLVLGPEFVYLRDVFGQRLNTIFKFYYAAWILWALAAAFGTHVLLNEMRPVLRGIFGVGLVALIAACLVYPAAAIPSKAGNFEQTPTLNGIRYIEQLHPGDYAGIMWLRDNAEAGAVVLEAVGGQYSYYGRVSMATGIPTVIGWPGHERQWRGPRFDEFAAGRETDVKQIYSTPSVQRATDLLAKYDVTYIFVGSLERDPGYSSAAGLEKFDRTLTAVYRDNAVTIYRADMPQIETQTNEP